jgi:hypothetical protein
VIELRILRCRDYPGRLHVSIAVLCKREGQSGSRNFTTLVLEVQEGSRRSLKNPKAAKDPPEGTRSAVACSLVSFGPLTFIAIKETKKHAA